MTKELQTTKLNKTYETVLLEGFLKSHHFHLSE